MNETTIQIKKCSKKYLYVLYTALFFVIKGCLLSLDEVKIGINKNMFGMDIIIYNHLFIKSLVEYFGYIIFGGIFSLIFDKKQIKNNSSSSSTKEIRFLFSERKIPFQIVKYIILSSVLFSIQLIVRTILYMVGTWCLDLWIFNIIFVCIFMKYILNTRIYKHQLYSLIFIFTINIILIIVASCIRSEKVDNGKSDFDTFSEIFGSYAYIGLFYIVYMSLSAIICSSEVMQKKLMDIHYVSISTLIFTIGIISSIFTVIVLLITSNIKCNDYLVEKQICTIHYLDSENYDTYFDSYNVYLKLMNDKEINDKLLFYLEIFLVYPL